MNGWILREIPEERIFKDEESVEDFSERTNEADIFANIPPQFFALISYNNRFYGNLM